MIELLQTELLRMVDKQCRCTMDGIRCERCLWLDAFEDKLAQQRRSGLARERDRLLVRVQELLEANTAEVERRRGVERDLSIARNHLHLLADQLENLREDERGVRGVRWPGK